MNPAFALNCRAASRQRRTRDLSNGGATAVLVARVQHRGSRHDRNARNRRVVAGSDVKGRDDDAAADVGAPARSDDTATARALIAGTLRAHAALCDSSFSRE